MNKRIRFALIIIGVLLIPAILMGCQPEPKAPVGGLLFFAELASDNEEAKWENELGRWKLATAIINDEEKALTSNYFEDIHTIEDGKDELIILFEWNEEGRRLSEEITGRLIGKPMGIFLGNESLKTKDGKPLAPIVVDVISDRGSIQGLSRDEAIKLADILQKQPVPLQEYLNTEYGFAIDVPINWAIRPESDVTSQKPSVKLQWREGQQTFSYEFPGSVIAWESPDKSAGMLLAVNERKVKSLDEWVQRAKDNSSDPKGFFKFLKSTKEGRDRVWIWMDYPQSHINMVWLTMLNETHEYSVIGFVRSEIQYEQQPKIIEYSISTFRIQRKQ